MSPTTNAVKNSGSAALSPGKSPGDQAGVHPKMGGPGKTPANRKYKKA